jgi:hypothetical protein
VATIKTRIQKDGTPSHRVVWRQGGMRDGSWDAAGQHWAEGWEEGVGYVEARAQSVTPAQPDRSL